MARFGNRTIGVARFLGRGGGPSGATSPRHTTQRTNNNAVIRGSLSEQKKFFAKAQGKSYASSDAFKNMEGFYRAVKKGEKSYVDTHGEVHDLTKISNHQKYIAQKWASRTDVRTKEGMQNLAKGFVATSRELDIELGQGKNLGTVTEAAGKIVKGVIPKAPEMDGRRQALETLHSRLTQPAPATAAAKPAGGTSGGNMHTQSMVFQTPEPLRTSPGSPTHTFGTTPTGGSSIVSPNTATPNTNAVQPGIPSLASVEPVAPPTEPVTPTPEPVAPASEPTAPVEPTPSAAPLTPAPPTPTPAQVEDPFVGSGE